MSLLIKEYSSETNVVLVSENPNISEKHITQNTPTHASKPSAGSNENKIPVKNIEEFKHVWIRENYFNNYKSQLRLLNDKDWELNVKKLKEGCYYDLILRSGELIFCFIYTANGIASSSFKPVRVINPMKVKAFKQSV